MITREELISEGWEVSHKKGFKIPDWPYFEKGNPHTDGVGVGFLELRSDFIKISTTDPGYNMDGPNSSVKFHGKCPDVETLRKICELIQLNL